MLPLIVISKDKQAVSSFIKNIIKDNNFTPTQIYRISPQKNQITISQMRELKHDLIIEQRQGRLIIFNNFGQSSIEAQNAVLKILEEKNLTNWFILTAENIEKILSTVISRCKIIRLDKGNCSRSIEKRWSDLLRQTETETSLEFFFSKELSNLTRDDALSLLNQSLIYFQDKLRSRAKDKSILPKIIKKNFQLLSQLERNNLNPQLTIDNLLIFIQKSYKKK